MLENSRGLPPFLYLKLIGADDHLRKFPRIDDLEELMNYPNLQALMIACKQEIDSNVPFGQFAVYLAKFIKPKQRPLPIVYGWNDQDCPRCRNLQRQCQGPCGVQHASVDHLRVTADMQGGLPSTCYGIDLIARSHTSLSRTVRAQLGQACTRRSLRQRSRGKRPA